jgi:hypothetical protein
MPDDYIFASKTMRGKQPFWPDNLMKRHIRPIPKAIGINKRIGWHTSATPSAQLPEGKRRRCEYVTGALTARQQQDHAGCLHASSEFA